MTSITIDTADGAMPAEQVDAQPGTGRAVIVIQEAFGVNGHIVDLCHRFAKVGWTAVAPALFHRQGSPVIPYDDVPKVMPIMQALTAEGIGADIDATSDALVAQGYPVERQAVVGFCMGGTVTFHAAVQRPFGAAATFYGGGITEGRWGYPGMAAQAGQLQTPWLGLFGDRDGGIPVDQVEQLRQAAAEQAKVDTEVVRYAEAQHGFHCDERPAVFDADAAADAWARTLAWFDAHIPA